MKQLFCIVLIGLAGCQQAADTAGPSDSPPGAATEDPSWDDLVTVDPVESSLDESACPTTPEALAKIFTEDYKQSPETAFLNLVDWEGVPEHTRRTVLGGLLSLAHPIDGSKTYPINPSSTKLYTVGDYSRELDMSATDYNEGRQVPITHVLEVEMEMGAGTTSRATLDLGFRDGHYYIYPEM